MSAIKEKTKRKPIGVKKILLRLFLSAVSGLVFAGCVIGAVIYLKPQLLELLKARPDSTIIIQSGNNATSDKENGDETEKDPVEENLPVTPSDVQAWQKKLYEIGTDAKNALVEVGENKEGDGIIFSITDLSVIILVTNCPNVQEMEVTFFDGVMATGMLYGWDKCTGIGVVFVKKKDIAPITAERLAMVQWGSTEKIVAGHSVIGVGSPTGERGSVIVGVVTETKHMVTFIDREHGVLDTDIAARKNAAGFLLNEEGALVGVITHMTDVENEANWIVGYNINDISAVVERLANNQALPFLGINGTTVTDEMNKEYGVPDGVYVNGVQEDSPAMIGNIQAGDVVTKMNGVEVKSLSDFYDALLERDLGENVFVTVRRLINGKYIEMTFELTVRGTKVESRGSYEVY